MKKKWTLGLTLLAGIALAGGVLTAVSAVEPLDVNAAAGDTYTVVTSEDQLAAGDKIIIVSEEANTNNPYRMIMSNQKAGGKYRTHVRCPDANISGSGATEKITWFDGNGDNPLDDSGEHLIEFTLGGSSGAWTIQDSETSEYLYFAKNSLYSGSVDVADEWSISFSSDIAESNIVIAEISPSEGPGFTIQFNGSNYPRFACYSSNQKDVSIFKKGAITPSTDPSVTITADSVNGLVGDEIMLLAEVKNLGETLTYNWSLAEGSENLVTIDAADEMAIVTLDAAGTATINLTVTDGEGKSASTSIDLDISALLSVKDAKVLPDNEIAYVKGIAFAKYGEAIFIADEDGTGMQLYTSSNPPGVTIGEEVTVKGTMDTYNGGRQLSNPEIIEHTVTEKVITPKVLTVSDLTEENINDYVTIKNLVWQDITDAGSNRNINFYEDGDMSKDLVLFDHFKNTSADAKELFDITVADWTSGVTTVDLSGAYMNYNGTHEIYLTYETNYEVDPLRTYAREFLAADLCDNGVTKPSKELWTTLKTSFEALDDTVQTALMEGLADEKGDVIAQALARYDYILGKYGEVEYENFMLRDVVLTKSNLGTTVFGDNANNTFITIGAAALLVMSGLVVVHFLNKKRRAN